MEVTFNDKALTKIIDALKNGENMHARVGILGRTNARDGGRETNATIGLRHELGLGVPQRSFLEMPIRTQLLKYVRSSKIMGPQTIADIASTGSLLPLMQKLGVAGEAVVIEAFNSGGYGEWIPSDMTHKKVQQTLVETQQLRNSITSEVVTG